MYVGGNNCVPLKSESAAAKTTATNGRTNRRVWTASENCPVKKVLANVVRMKI